MGSIAATVGRPLRFVGVTAERAAIEAAQVASLVAGIVAATWRGQVALRDVVDQAYVIGAQSLPLVLVTSALSGLVTTQQGGYQFTGALPLYILGSVVVS